MKVLLIAGNGLSLSLLNESPVPGVDLINLFSRGGDVAWPADNTPGFLSFEHCPNLWALGARPHVDRDTGYSVIEKVLSAVNACCMADPSTLQSGIYLNAYKELVSYLRYLFVHYDTAMAAANFFESARGTPLVKWFQELHSSSRVSAVDVVTFNYDVMLERCLAEVSIPFSIPKLSEESGAKIRIHKPHGSISFCSKVEAERSAFSIKYDTQFAEGGLDEICVRYNDLDANYPVVGILPPAGESERYKHRWIRQIWDSVTQAVESIEDEDVVVLYGLSYWHVDRKEIDHLLAKVSRRARVVMINPRPNEQLDAVCCSLFRSYQAYHDATHLKRIAQ